MGRWVPHSPSPEGCFPALASGRCSWRSVGSACGDLRAFIDPVQKIKVSGFGSSGSVTKCDGLGRKHDGCGGHASATKLSVWWWRRGGLLRLAAMGFIHSQAHSGRQCPEISTQCCSCGCDTAALHQGDSQSSAVSRSIKRLISTATPNEQDRGGMSVTEHLHTLGRLAAPWRPRRLMSFSV